MEHLCKQDTARIDREEEKYLSTPYGGLFGNAAIVQIVEEMISDPFIDYRVKDLENQLALSTTSITNSLKTLVNLGLVIREEKDPQRSIYRINLNSKKYRALTFLTYAITDDHEHSSLMDREIERYYQGLMAKVQYRNQAQTLPKVDLSKEFKKMSQDSPHSYPIQEIA